MRFIESLRKKPIGHYIPMGFILYKNIFCMGKLFAKLFLEKSGKSFFLLCFFLCGYNKCPHFLIFVESFLPSFFSKKRESSFAYFYFKKSKW